MHFRPSLDEESSKQILLFINLFSFVFYKKILFKKCSKKRSSGQYGRGEYCIKLVGIMNSFVRSNAKNMSLLEDISLSRGGL